MPIATHLPPFVHFPHIVNFHTPLQLFCDKQVLNGKPASIDDFAEPTVNLHVEKRRYIKNLLVLAMAYFCLWSAYTALRNLQSSLNAVGGLGLYSLSSMQCSLLFGGLCSTTIVQRLQPKRAISLCLIGYIIFAAANFYPRIYTMVPASVIHGFFVAVGFTAISTYLANISARYAELVGKQMSHVFSQFLGTFYVFSKFSQIAGGLISSLLLSKANSHRESIHSGSPYMKQGNDSLDEGSLCRNITNGDNNFTLFCGSSYCPSDGMNTESDSDVDETTLLILMGCFGASTVVGCITVIFFSRPSRRSHEKVKCPAQSADNGRVSRVHTETKLPRIWSLILLSN